MKKAQSFASLMMLAFLVACGTPGAQWQGASLPPFFPPGAGISHVAFVVIVPAATSSSRAERPAFVATSGTQSASFTLVSINGTAVSAAITKIANFTSSSNDCESAGGQLSCVANVAAPAGALVYEIAIYANLNGTGTPIAEGMISVTTCAGRTTTVTGTLSGTVAKIVVSLVGGAELGASASLPVIVSATDANGYTILGNYTNPITLSDTDPSGQTSLSSTAALSSSTAAGSLTLNYTGGEMSSAATIGATAAGVGSSNVTPATFLPDATSPTVNGSSTNFAYTQSYTDGYDGSPSGSGSKSGTYGVSVATGQSYNGISDLVAITGLLDPTTNSPISLDSTAVTYFAWSSQGDSAVLEYVGFSDADRYDAQTCAAPYSRQLVLPLPASWSVLSGAGPCTYTSNFNGGTADMENETTVFASDGSYSDNGSYSVAATEQSYYRASQPGGSASITENSPEGSSILTIPVPSPGAAIVSVTYELFPGSIPEPGPTSGISGTPPPQPSATPVPVTTTAPNPWLAAGVSSGVPPAPLLSDTFANTGSITSLPPQCAVSAGIIPAQPSLSEADETIIQADPMNYWYALYATSTIKHYYLNGVGEVCNEDVLSAWDFAGQPVDWYDGSNRNYDTYSQTQWTYVTATSLVATEARVRSFARALPATTQAFTAASYALIRARMGVPRNRKP